MDERTLVCIASTIVSAVGSGFLSHLLTLKRERAKDRREAHQTAEAALDAICSDARVYHTQTTPPPELSLELKSKLTRLSTLFQRLGCDASKEILLLRQAVTLRNFDASDHRALDPADPLFGRLEAAATAIRSLLDDCQSS